MVRLSNCELTNPHVMDRLTMVPMPCTMLFSRADLVRVRCSLDHRQRPCVPAQSHDFALFADLTARPSQSNGRPGRA
eukprot:7208917-Prymnesium_polylepis.1